MVGEESAAGQVDRFLGVTAANPALLLIQRRDGDIARAQPQCGVAFPFLSEADGLGELDVAHLAGEHDHPAAPLDRGELLVVPGDQHPALMLAGQAHDRGEVGHRHHRRLIEQEQRSGPQGPGAAGFPGAGEVAEEVGGVGGQVHPGLVQDVAGGLGGGQPVHLPQARLAPEPGDDGSGPGLAGSGRADQDLGAPVAGHREERGGRLIQPQPRARIRLFLFAALRPGAELSLQLSQIRAEEPRRYVRRNPGRARLLSLRHQALFQGQLGQRGVPGAAVRPVDAAPVRPAQRVRHPRPLGGLQHQHPLPRAAGQHLVGQIR